jgi:hypothetical protein
VKAQIHEDKKGVHIVLECESKEEQKLLKQAQYNLENANTYWEQIWDHKTYKKAEFIL